jgi:hypothetical protein
MLEVVIDPRELKQSAYKAEGRLIVLNSKPARLVVVIGIMKRVVIVLDSMLLENLDDYIGDAFLDECAAIGRMLEKSNTGFDRATVIPKSECITEAELPKTRDKTIEISFAPIRKINGDCHLLIDDLARIHTI